MTWLILYAIIILQFSSLKTTSAYHRRKHVEATVHNRITERKKQMKKKTTTTVKSTVTKSTVTKPRTAKPRAKKIRTVKPRAAKPPPIPSPAPAPVRNTRPRTTWIAYLIAGVIAAGLMVVLLLLCRPYCNKLPAIAYTDNTAASLQQQKAELQKQLAEIQKQVAEKRSVPAPTCMPAPKPEPVQAPAPAVPAPATPAPTAPPPVINNNNFVNVYGGTGDSQKSGKPGASYASVAPSTELSRKIAELKGEIREKEAYLALDKDAARRDNSVPRRNIVRQAGIEKQEAQLEEMRAGLSQLMAEQRARQP